MRSIFSPSLTIAHGSGKRKKAFNYVDLLTANSRRKVTTSSIHAKTYMTLLSSICSTRRLNRLTTIPFALVVCFLFCLLLVVSLSQINLAEHKNQVQDRSSKSKLPTLIDFKPPEQSNLKEAPNAFGNGNQCIILIWLTDSNKLQEDWPSEGSVYGSCSVTYFHNSLKKARAVVFHQSDAEGLLPWKMRRNEKQVFVWWSDINPWAIKHYFNEDLKQFAGFFNWTMTYRRDSDVTFPIFTIEMLYKNLGSDTMKDLGKILQKKSKSAVWYVNDCLPTKGNHKRMKIAVDMIKAGLEIDSLGNCFLSNQPLQDLEPYRFYLAFTDGYHCRDYVSGQLWIPLLNGLVPVVFGPTLKDVARIAPRGSFIHVDQFNTVTDLVAYLKKLEADFDEYSKFFRWREKVQSAAPATTGWMRLSDKLQKASETYNPLTFRKTIDNLDYYVFDTENPECISVD